MKSTHAILFFALAGFGSHAKASAACPPGESARFICGTVNSEDLVPLPKSRWVISSGATGPGVQAGGLFLIDANTKHAEPLYPVARNQYRQDRTMFGDCPGKPEQEPFIAGGLNARRIENGRYTLYVVHHGERESIEVFEVDIRGEKPELIWVGCVIVPTMPQSELPWLANAVTPLPDSAFAVTVNPSLDRGDPEILAKVTSGQVKGLVLTWTPGSGWRDVQGSELPGNNGIEASPDGQWLYVNASFEPGVHRVSLARTPADHSVVKTTFNPDNIRWGDDGFLYVTGPTGRTGEAITCAGKHPSCPIPFKVLRIDPRTLQSEELVNEPGGSLFGLATGVAKVGGEIWVSSVRGTRIATFPLK